MTNNGKLATLALAGLAAYAYKKYSKMSPDQKENLASDLKEKGRGLAEKYIPENMRNLFGFSKDNSSTTGQPNASTGF